MKTSDFVLAILGLTNREEDFINDLCDNKFPSFGDWGDSVIYDFEPSRTNRLSNYLIQTLFDEIIGYATERGLDKSLFDYNIDSVCSNLYYDGLEIANENELYDLIESVKN